MLMEGRDFKERNLRNFTHFFFPNQSNSDPANPYSANTYFKHINERFL